MWFLVPLAFWMLATALHLKVGDFYQLSVDPEYPLLYNGIVVGTGSFAINFIDHPATPLIFIIGTAARLFHLFTAELSYLQDFLNDPEKYITAANILNNLFIAFALTYAGIKVKKYSGSILLALVIQLSIFSHHSLIGISSRLIPESTMMIPLILISALTIKYIYNSNQQRIKPYLWQFPLLIAFGVGCKLSFGPMLLFPFILLNTTARQKINLLGYSILFCCIFAYPILTNFEASYQWFSSMATHSGQHGSGEMNIINWIALPTNFNELLAMDPWFFVLMVINFILLLINSLSLDSKPSDQSIRISRAQKATLITLTLIALFTLKHFALHYFMPFLVFRGLLILLIVLFLKELIFVVKSVNILRPLVRSSLIITLLFVVNSAAMIAKTSDNFQKNNKAADEHQLYILEQMDDKNAALIVDAPYWGSPFETYAHAFGFMKAHKRKTYFKIALKEKFPRFYWFVGWTDEFNHW
ncbi:MAG: hypothetical protein WD530_05300, partial [Vicingaceae bacterium]